jgi:hypothetical protein
MKDIIAPMEIKCSVVSNQWVSQTLDTEPLMTIFTPWRRCCGDASEILGNARRGLSASRPHPCLWIAKSTGSKTKVA